MNQSHEDGDENATSSFQSSAIHSAIVGLSPSFWAHVPLFAKQIHTLYLSSEGVCCISRCLSNTDDHSWLPVSKCCVVGCVVAFKIQNFGSSFVIDDGTGLIDCRLWEDNSFQRRVPRLLDDSSENTTPIKVGDIMKVWGRLDVTVVEGEYRPASSSSSNIATELRVNRYEKLADGACNRAAPLRVDGEMAHASHVIEYHNNAQYCSAETVLDWLGPKWAQQVERRENFPKANDTIGAWRFFGSDCQCPWDKIKTHLLYCPCVSDSKDREWSFRVELMSILLERASNDKPYFFHYKELTNHPCLQQRQNSSRSLLQGTLAALRSDGIIFHFDVESDTYLLNTVPAVLEPYVSQMYSPTGRRSVLGSALQKQKPLCIQNVPSGRIQLVRRMVEQRFNVIP